MNYKSIDIMKFICAIFVVIIHTNPFYGTGLSFYVDDNIARLAVPLFLITSGYLFYGKYQKDKKYVFKYIRNIIKIIIICAIVYLPYNIYSICTQDKHPIWVESLVYIRDLLLNGTFWQLWYLNALVMGIAFICILNRYMSLKKIGIISLVLYLFGMLGDAYNGLFDDRIKHVMIGIYSAFFEVTRNGILFATIFLVIGMLIYENKQYLKISKKNNIALVVIFTISLFVETYFIRKFGLARDYNMMLSLLFLAPALFILILNTSIEIKNAKIYRSLSLWVYCAHGVFLIIGADILKMHDGFVFFIFTLSLSIISYFIVDKAKVFFKQKDKMQVDRY